MLSSPTPTTEIQHRDRFDHRAASSPAIALATEQGPAGVERDDCVAANPIVPTVGGSDRVDDRAFTTTGCIADDILASASSPGSAEAEAMSP
jgi:hypothetical protein